MRHEALLYGAVLYFYCPLASCMRRWLRVLPRARIGSSGSASATVRLVLVDAA
jgi:hypothetical protein